MNHKTSTITLKSNTKQMALVGLMAAVICILGPISLTIPISPVPISLGSMAVYFAVSVLGMRRGTVSVIIYVLLGFAGLPVFSGFSGGAGKLFGPTGGYIIGFLFMAFICGFFVDRFSDKVLFLFPGMLLGTACCYLFGTAWLSYQASLTFAEALAAGVIPFLPGDLVKLVLALSIGLQLRRRLQKAGLL